MSSTDGPPAKKLCTESAGVAKASETDTPTEPTPSGPVPKPGPVSNPSQVKTDEKANDKEPVDKIKSVIAETAAGHPQQQDNNKSGVKDNGVAKVNENAPVNSVGKQGEKKTEIKCPSSEEQKEIKKNMPSVSVSGQHNGYNVEQSQRVVSEMDHVDLSKVIEGIQECDLEIEEMTISANQRVMEIEKSLRESKKPVYSKRSVLIQHIPEFWLTTLINHHHISHFINEADEDCLQYLRKLHVEEFDDSVSGFKISFIFEPNPYFENEIICKEISYGPSGVLRSKASPIRWRPGHDLTRVTEASASSSKSQPQSFFHWFIQNANPVQDKIAVFIRDDIWPNPLKYFQVHTEDSTIDVSSDGIMIDSSGEEDEDGSILVLEEDKEEDYYLDDEEDNEDIELLENEEEILDEDFEDSEDELLLDDDEDEEDFDGDEELQLIEARGMAKQRTGIKNASSLPQKINETGNVSQRVEKASNKQTVVGDLKQPAPLQPIVTKQNETAPSVTNTSEKTATTELTPATATEKEKNNAPKQDDS